jgi:hypothetical protein
LPGVLVAVLLIASLLLVHFSMRSRPMPTDKPLNVDVGLPLPEAGQASTVFSLTALFGAYFGIYLVLGLPALAGLACGTVFALFLIRSWIFNHRSSTFEDFLRTVLDGDSGNAGAFALTISAVQCAFAASELLIFREITRVSLGIRSDQATLLAIAVGIVGYFYVLFGGYMAVFRTDVLQLLLVGGMAVAFGIHAMSGNMSQDWKSSLLPRAGYWEPPLGFAVDVIWKYVYHFVIGSVMGLGFLLAAPDAWKRVFIVTVFRKKTLVRFLVFIGIGIAPFLILLPLAFATPSIPNGPISVKQMFAGLLAGNFLFVAASLGLIASFLSSFDGAVLASVHVGLMLRRKLRYHAVEVPRFHWLMATALLVIFLLFSSLVSFGNPYLLANLLLGPYAILAGIAAGTRATPACLPKNSVLWIVVCSFVFWFIYFWLVIKFPGTPTTYQVNTVPGGVCIFLLVGCICYALTTWRGRDAGLQIHS